MNLNVSFIIGLQLLRAEREQAQSDIESLVMEKRAIKSILPRVVHQLRLSRDNVNHKVKDIQLYDTAILEIESKYSHILYSIQES